MSPATLAAVARPVRLVIFEELIRAGVIAPETDYEAFKSQHGAVIDEMVERIVEAI